MPTYEYECQKCGTVFERFQSMTEERLKSCPECKGKVKRLLGTGAGIIFKGSGFYETDYRSDNYKSDAKKDTTSSSPASKSTDKKSADKKATTSKASSKPKKSE